MAGRDKVRAVLRRWTDQDVPPQLPTTVERLAALLLACDQEITAANAAMRAAQQHHERVALLRFRVRSHLVGLMPATIASSRVVSEGEGATDG